MIHDLRQLRSGDTRWRIGMIHGPNMPFGQGDTPIKEVLQLLKRTQWDIPANIEFEYPGDPLVEMPKCLAYCKEALA